VGPRQASTGLRPVRPHALTRARFLRGALFTGGVVLLGGVPFIARAPRVAHAVQSPETDAKILNFALLLEYLEDAFYSDALARDALSGDLLAFAQEVSRHEAAHVELLQDALGEKARPRPSFDFGDATSDPERFSSAAVLLEETGSAAYIGQGANLSADVVVYVGRITSVEARHTAWIRDIIRRHPAPHAADASMTQEEVSAAIQRTGFLP
jgi:hypothetical protein